MLFIVGLLTSVHCVAMCGGINLSQTVGKTGIMSSILYNLGRVISYTVIGIAVGALGSILSFSYTAQGIIKLIAGLLMLLMGINMLGIFPFLNKFLNPFRKINTNSKSPFIVGLLGGFIPCGPLQSMQIYALSTGSWWAGGLSMLLFSLGTVPLMFALGSMSSIMSKKFAKTMMTVGAILVTVLALSMFSQGWVLAGISTLYIGQNSSNVADNEIIDGVQIVNSTLTASKYPSITVKSGIPVKWTINAPSGSINGCNETMYINEYNIEYSFTTGENIIEFTPTDTGTFRYTCWMGMKTGTITVVE